MEITKKQFIDLIYCQPEYTFVDKTIINSITSECLGRNHISQIKLRQLNGMFPNIAVDLMKLLGLQQNEFKDAVRYGVTLIYRSKNANSN